MITIREAATLAGVSKDKCRYWLKLLDLEMVKQDGKLFLPDNAADLLQTMKKAVDSGLAPVAAAQDVKNIHVLPTAQEVNQDNQKNDIVLDKLEALERSVLLLAQTVEKQNQVITDQAKQIKTLSTRLLPPPLAEKKPVTVWQPVEKKAPQVSWLKRAWYELTNPARLRATP
jgi:DNA-binding transcriptional MerR regulator